MGGKRTLCGQEGTVHCDVRGAKTQNTLQCLSQLAERTDDPNTVVRLSVYHPRETFHVFVATRQHSRMTVCRPGFKDAETSHGNNKRSRDDLSVVSARLLNFVSSLVRPPIQAQSFNPSIWRSSTCPKIQHSLRVLRLGGSTDPGCGCFFPRKHLPSKVSRTRCCSAF